MKAKTARTIKSKAPTAILFGSSIMVPGITRMAFSTNLSEISGRVPLAIHVEHAQTILIAANAAWLGHESPPMYFWNTVVISWSWKNLKSSLKNLRNAAWH